MSSSESAVHSHHAVSVVLHKLAISGYRSLKEIVLPLAQLNLITGPNGSGKSNIYRALRLLAETAQGGLIQSLAREGGLQSTLWAGPEKISREMGLGHTPVQGGPRKKPVSLRLGFSSDDFSYSIDLGLPSPSQTAFFLDPIIKRECVWQGHQQRPSTLCTDRRGGLLRCRDGEGTWQNIELPMMDSTSVLSEFTDPVNAPEIVLLRDSIRSWRFYDHFRTDAAAPARRAEVGTYTPAMSDDGSDLGAALQTIREFGDHAALNAAIEDAFPGSELSIERNGSRLEVCLQQDGMLRELRSAELSDGTLRFLLLVAALLTPRPPELMVLNEPETSLHPELLPALGRLIAQYAEQRQTFVVTHAKPLIEQLSQEDQCVHFELEKTLGATEIVGAELCGMPAWKWPAR